MRYRLGTKSTTLFAVVAIAGLAGCGASATTSSSSGSKGRGSKAGSINLGVQAPLTGSRATAGQGMVIGATLAVNVINANGGVLGHQVKLSTQDDAADPADAVPAAETLINVDHVVAIDGPLSFTAGVVLPLAAKAKIPMLMWGGGAEFDHETSPYFYRMSPSDTEMADAMAVYAYEKGWTRVALAFGTATADTSIVAPLKTALQRLGMTVTVNQTFAAGSTSFSSELSNVFNSHPQAILGQVSVASAAIIFGEMQQEGLATIPWVGTNLWFGSDFFSSVGKTTATGPIYMLNPGTENGGYGPFLTLWKQAKGTNTPEVGSTFAYDAANVWALGAQAAGTVSSPGIEAGIQKVTHGSNVCTAYVSCLKLLKEGRSISYDGASSSVNFDKYHNVYGPFDVLHFNADGTATTLQELTPQDIQKKLGLG